MNDQNDPFAAIRIDIDPLFDALTPPEPVQPVDEAKLLQAATLLTLHVQREIERAYTHCKAVVIAPLRIEITDSMAHKKEIRLTELTMRCLKAGDKDKAAVIGAFIKGLNVE